MDAGLSEAGTAALERQFSLAMGSRTRNYSQRRKCLELPAHRSLAGEHEERSSPTRESSTRNDIDRSNFTVPPQPPAGRSPVSRRGAYATGFSIRGSPVCWHRALAWALGFVVPAALASPGAAALSRHFSRRWTRLSTGAHFRMRCSSFRSRSDGAADVVAADCRPSCRPVVPTRRRR